ncbi:hypothetical protein AD949_08215 [Acetobacter orleanensis]|nr:hypothetical protein AD949_08215 [Acetobacter orleanensis]PCD78846.1 hypothetical protein CO710_10285 [Acetobacter orleanensis]
MLIPYKNALLSAHRLNGPVSFKENNPKQHPWATVQPVFSGHITFSGTVYLYRVRNKQRPLFLS